MKNNNYKALILTDHSHHTNENSLYELAVKLHLHSSIKRVDIASRATLSNAGFFNCILESKLFATQIDESFIFDSENHPLENNIREVAISDYDFVWLRLPPPVHKDCLEYIADRFKNQVVINNPKAIYETGSKEFLMNFQSICPPMKICKTAEEIIEFKKQFPIVLKPFREYGGKGIVKIDGDVVWKQNRQLPFDVFLQEFESDNNTYLGVKYLRNVDKGDKRIIVVNGEILGASLRLPPKNSWICNVSMGGSSNVSEISPEEYQIVDIIDPVLSKMGIVMYGVDTLVGDNGKRVLSEINTTSIGGLPQIARLKGKPLVEKAIDLILAYFEENAKSKTNI